MPRRNKPAKEELTSETVLALPPPQVVTHHKKEIDPYQAPPGAVPGKVVNLKESRKPITRKRTSSDLAKQEEAKREMAERAARYEQYVELQINGVPKDEALAAVYNQPLEEIRANRTAYLADVRTGLGSSEMATIMEENDLTLQVRAKVLRDAMFSDNLAGRLKAVQMIGELEGDRGNVGSFEQFLRMAKQQKE